MIVSLKAPDLQLPEFAQIGGLFFQEAGFSHRFDADVFRKNWEALIGNGSGHILGKFADGKLVAILGFVIAPDLNDGKPVAYETFWFTLPEYRGVGLELVKRYEQAAKDKGAKRISMVHLETLNAGRLRMLYTRMGFTPAEVHYFKEIE